MKLCCDWCRREITSALPHTWGRYHFCSVAHKHYMIAGLNGDRRKHAIPDTVSNVRPETKS